MFVLLSHPLSPATPLYPGTPPIRTEPLKQIARGDSSNTYLLHLPGHAGTHLDTPRHFDPNGRAVTGYGIDSLIFEHPVSVQVPKEAGALIDVADLMRHEATIDGADFVLIETGFQSFRTSAPTRYANENPGFSASAARYLVDQFPKLRGLGLDTISLSSVLHREEGRTAHRILLTERDFFIVEDMDLADIPSGLRRLFVVPLFVEGVDGTPCTVIGEV
jgi:kynurenine formamidase